MAKFEKQLFNQKKIFWHDTSSYTCSIYIILLMKSIRNLQYKAIVQVDFPVYAQAKSLFKSKQEKKGLISKSCYFVKKHFFWHEASSCKCSMSLYCVGKILNCFGTSCGTS